jgi:trehalose-phosphatase
LHALNPATDLQAFFDRVRRAPAGVLCVDYDGTLAPFHEHPERALPYPTVAKALEELMSGDATRVVIVSGRALADLLPLLPFKRRPEVWGAHGWQRLLPDGRQVEREVPTAVHDKLDEAQGFARASVGRGARLERKPASVALHWRGLQEGSVAAVRAEVEAPWQRLAEASAVELMEFDGGLELRAHGHNKHHAVKTVLSETAGEAAVAYLGDDVTDEDAFAAVKTAHGLAVLVRAEPRPTRADVWIRPPQELVAFLERWRGERAGRN